MLGAGAVMQRGAAGAKLQDMLALKDSCRGSVGGCHIMLGTGDVS